MENYVLWFNIPVDDSVRVEFVDCLTDLAHDGGNFGLRHALMFFELFEELPACPHLKDDVNVDGIIEKAVHSDDIGMIQVCLYFELPNELLGYLLLLQ